MASRRPPFAVAQVYLNPLGRNHYIANLHLLKAGNAHGIEPVFDAEGYTCVLGQVVQAATGVEQLQEHGAGSENHGGEEWLK